MTDACQGDFHPAPPKWTLLRNNSEPAIVLWQSLAMESRGYDPAEPVCSWLLGQDRHFGGGVADDHQEQIDRTLSDPSIGAAELTDQVGSCF